jgi:hypothetical protein
LSSEVDFAHGGAEAEWLVSERQDTEKNLEGKEEKARDERGIVGQVRVCDRDSFDLGRPLPAFVAWCHPG